MKGEVWGVRCSAGAKKEHTHSGEPVLTDLQNMTSYDMYNTCIFPLLVGISNNVTSQKW